MSQNVHVFGVSCSCQMTTLALAVVTYSSVARVAGRVQTGDLGQQKFQSGDQGQSPGESLVQNPVQIYNLQIV